MKKILVPVDFSPLCESLIDYVAVMGGVLQVGEVILIKAFHISSLALLLPSTDMLLLSVDEINNERGFAQKRVDDLATYLRRKSKNNLIVNSYLVEASWQTAIEETISIEEPDLVVIGHDAQHQDAEDTWSGRIIPFAQQCQVPVLLIPYGAIYSVPKNILIPTTFENLERLGSFKKLFQSKLWRSVTITVLHIKAQQSTVEVKKEQLESLQNYLLGFFYQIVEISENNIAGAILDFADQRAVDLIFALPAKHSFLHQFFYQGITRPFALHAKQPVLLLK